MTKCVGLKIHNSLFLITYMDILVRLKLTWAIEDRLSCSNLVEVQKLSINEELGAKMA